MFMRHTLYRRIGGLRTFDRLHATDLSQILGSILPRESIESCQRTAAGVCGRARGRWAIAAMRQWVVEFESLRYGVVTTAICHQVLVMRFGTLSGFLLQRFKQLYRLFLPNSDLVMNTAPSALRSCTSDLFLILNHVFQLSQKLCLLSDLHYRYQKAPTTIFAVCNTAQQTAKMLRNPPECRQ